MKTIVEGAETEEELAWVREKGAIFAQDYRVAKPTTPPTKHRLTSSHN